MRNEDYMAIALVARRSADCRKSQVGAVLVPAEGDSNIYIGWNGATPMGTTCVNGGCLRCANPEKYPRGKGYDVCICVHAEEHCVLAAGPFAKGGTVYSTMRPCTQCSKQLLQVGVTTVYYQDDFPIADPAEREAYERLQKAFSGGVHLLSDLAEEAA